jgi:hypothetical protein
VDHVLVVLALVVIWGLFLLVFPTKACRCAGRCPRCKGTGRRFRLGARHMRKALLALRKEWKKRNES